jgi:hypothetical protein
MAKRKTKARTRSSSMTKLAEDLGTLLGTGERKASEWLAVRQDVARQLTAIRDQAGSLLSRLGAATASATARPRTRAKKTRKATPRKAAARKAVSRRAASARTAPARKK